MSNTVIQATVVYESGAESCNAACGLDWSSAEAADTVTRQISERFGIWVELEYVDLSQPATTPRLTELKRLVEDENIPLPMLVIDGQPRISGKFDVRLLLDAIDAELEIKKDEGQI